MGSGDWILPQSAWVGKVSIHEVVYTSRIGLKNRLEFLDQVSGLPCVCDGGYAIYGSSLPIQAGSLVAGVEVADLAIEAGKRDEICQDLLVAWGARRETSIPSVSQQSSYPPHSPIHRSAERRCPIRYCGIP